MALVYKAHIQGGSDNTTSFPNNHPYISSCIKKICKLQLATTYVGMVMWEWCVITATLYVYFVDQCHPYILLSVDSKPHLEMPNGQAVNNHYYTVESTKHEEFLSNEEMSRKSVTSNFCLPKLPPNIVF